MPFQASRLQKLAIRAQIVRRALFDRFRDLGSISHLTDLPRGIVHGTADPFLLTGRSWSGALGEASRARALSDAEHGLSAELDVLEFLYDAVRATGARSAAEIGVYHGAGSLALAQGLADNGGGALHLIDIDEAFLRDAAALVDEHARSVEVHTHCVAPDDPQLAAPVSDLDLVFVDGDHAYAAARRDVEAWWARLAPGGRLLMHDTIGEVGARRVSQELFDRGERGFTLATSGGAGISCFQKAPPDA